MLSQITLVALFAGVMALAKIEHRAEGTSASANNWSKYYAKFQEYLKGNNALNIPDSPTAAFDQIQSDSQQGQNPFNYQQYFKPGQSQGSSGGQGAFNGFNQETAQNYFRDCMGQSAQIPGFSSSGNTGSGSSNSQNEYQNYFKPDEWQKRWEKCRQNMSQGYNAPGVSANSDSPSSEATSSSS